MVDRYVSMSSKQQHKCLFMTDMTEGSVGSKSSTYAIFPYHVESDTRSDLNTPNEEPTVGDN